MLPSLMVYKKNRGLLKLDWLFEQLLWVLFFACNQACCDNRFDQYAQLTAHFDWKNIRKMSNLPFEIRGHCEK